MRVIVVFSCLLGLFSAHPAFAAGQVFNHPLHIYSLTYPDDWKIQDAMMKGTTVITPPEIRDAFCLSRAESNPDIVGMDQEELVDTMMHDKGVVEGIKDSNTDAGGFSIKKVPVQNGVGHSVTFSTADKKTSMLLVFNTITGHAVDLTCSTDLNKWEKYRPAIEAMQQSILLGKGLSKNQNAANFVPTAPVVTPRADVIPAPAQEPESGMLRQLMQTEKAPEKVRDSGSLATGGTDTTLPDKVLLSTPDFVGDDREAVEERMNAVRENITALTLPSGNHIPAETPEELKTPVIPYEDAKRVMNRGIVTAIAQYCGFDWQQLSYNPFMVHEIESHKWSDKQIAYIGALHGATQGMMHRAFITKGPCNEKSHSNASILLGIAESPAKAATKAP